MVHHEKLVLTVNVSTELKPNFTVTTECLWGLFLHHTPREVTSSQKSHSLHDVSVNHSCWTTGNIQQFCCILCHQYWHTHLLWKLIQKFSWRCLQY